MIKKSIAQCALIALLLMLGACAIHTTKSVTAINKSPNDNRSYSSIELNNKLQVLLISDPTLETAGASLSVGVGSFQNPKELPGLAHFLEHMLFLGTEKYPEANSFQKFIKENAGSSNAYTATDHTNYFFEVNKTELTEALDRFSDYFKSPSFDINYIEKERNAVDSEWSLSQKDDGRIIHRLRGVTANIDHPLQQISVGNKDTLKNNDEINLSEQTRRFFNQYYSANNMKLVLFGNLSLAKLEDLAHKNFSTIENKNSLIPEVNTKGLTKNVLGQHIYYAPQKPLKKLIVEFPLVIEKSQWQSKSTNYIENILSSEEPNTLAAVLREKGWVSSLTTNSNPFFYGKDGFLSVNINLTDLGLQKENEIIAHVFKYISLIKKLGVNVALYNETKMMVQKAYKNMQTPSALMQAVHFSAELFNVPAEHIIDAPYYYGEINQQEVNHILSSLTPENARIWHINKEAEQAIKLKYYDAAYSIKKFTDNDYLMWNKNSHNFSLPIANDLINTEDTEITTALYDTPKAIVNTDSMEAWLMHSQHYQSEMGILNVVFNTKEPHENIKSWVIASLVNRIFSMQTTALQDKAGRAGIGIKISRPNGNHAISLTGYSEKHETLYRQLLEKWVNFKATKQELTIAREGFIRRLAGKKQSKLYRQLFVELNRIVKASSWSDEELMAAVLLVTEQDISQYLERMLNNSRIRIFGYGNYNDTTIKNIAQYSQQTLGSERKPKARYFTEYLVPRSGDIKNYTAETEQADNALLLAFYAPEPSLEVAADIALLNTLFHNAFYTELRTEEQIGYVVGSSYDQLDKYWGFLVYAQSTNTSLVALKRRFDKFIGDFTIELENMDEEVFSQLQSAVIAQIKQKPENFNQESGQYFSDFYRGNDAFDSKQKLIAAIQNSSKQSILSRYQALLLEKKALQVQVQLKGTAFKSEPFSH